MAAALGQNETLSAAAAVDLCGSRGYEPDSGQSSDINLDVKDASSFSFSSQHCTCCPYGYHIDLDFLQFLDSLYSPDNLKTLKRIRRKVHSSLSPEKSECINVFSLNHKHAKETENIILTSDGEGISTQEILDEIDATVGTQTSRIICQLHDQKDANEFECRPDVKVYLQKELLDSGLSDSQNSVSEVTLVIKSENGENDITGTEKNQFEPGSPVGLFECSSWSRTTQSRKLFGDVVDSESGRVSPVVLQTIREQLAASLMRMKALEEQNKIIPILQTQVLRLKEENSRLLLTNNKTVHDAAVCDFPVEKGLPSSMETTPAGEPDTTVGEGGHALNELTSDQSCLQSEQHSNTTNISKTAMSQSEMFSLSKTVASASHRINLNTVEVGVNTDESLEPRKTGKTRSIAVLCKAATRDSSTGFESTRFVDVSTSAEDLSVLNQDLQTSAKPHEELLPEGMRVEVKDSVDDIRSNAVTVIDAKFVGGSRDYLGADEFDVSYFGRFRSIGIQCGFGDVSCFGDEIRRWSLPVTSTADDSLLSNLVASYDVKRREETKIKANEIDPKSHSDLPSSGIKKNVMFGEVIIYTTEKLSDHETSPENHITVLPLNDESGTDFEFKQLATSKRNSECLDAIVSETVPIEGIVLEHVLESARCGESVVIYDSCESSSTSSDSEEGSALSVLEVSSSTTAVHKAVKSVDDYFPDDGHSKISETNLDQTNLTQAQKCNLASDVIQSFSVFHSHDNPTDRQDKNHVVEVNDVYKESVYMQLSSAEKIVTSSSENKTASLVTSNQDKDQTRLFSQNSYVEQQSQSLEVILEVPELSSPETQTRTDVSDTDDYSSPVTEHVEFVQSTKQHSLNIEVPAVQKEIFLSELQELLSDRSVATDSHSLESINTDVLSKVDLSDKHEDACLTKRIVITETRIERRRIRRESGLDDKELLADDKVEEFSKKEVKVLEASGGASPAKQINSNVLQEVKHDLVCDQRKVMDDCNLQEGKREVVPILDEDAETAKENIVTEHPENAFDDVKNELDSQTGDQLSTEESGAETVQGVVQDAVQSNTLNKKEKSTDCDSALIPLFCVHG